MNGCLGGLVAITAGCCVIQPWVSVIVGVIGGFVYYSFSKFLIFMRIDDAVDAVPVHFANGIWGVLAVGLFSHPDLQDIAYGVGEDTHVGWFYDLSDPMLLAIEAIQVGFIIAWVTVCMVPFFVLLRCTGLFRVDPIEEEVGLDVPSDDAIEKLNNSRKGSTYALPPAPAPAPPAGIYEAPAPSVGSYGGSFTPEPMGYTSGSDQSA